MSIEKLGINPLQRFPSRWKRHALEDHTQNKTMAALSTVKGVARLTGGGAAQVHSLCASLELYVQDLSDHETRTWRKGSS